MKVSMKGQSKFQKRFALLQKENSNFYNIFKNQSSVVHKNKLFKRPIFKNQEKDTREFSLSKHPHHLTLMNLGVDQDQKEMILNSQCTTKRRTLQKFNSQAKIKLLKITNPKNSFIVTSFSQTPKQNFLQTQYKTLNDEKKQNFFDMIKRKRNADKNNRSYENYDKKQNNKMLFVNATNLQQRKDDLRQVCHPIIKTRRNHKNKVLNFISNRFLKSDLQQKEELQRKKKSCLIQNIVEKYEFKNLKVICNPTIKTFPNKNDDVKTVKTHNRYETNSDLIIHHQLTEYDKNIKATTSIFSPSCNRQAEKTTRKNNRQIFSLKKIIKKKDQKQKSFRAECLTPWTENDRLMHDSQDIF